MQYLVKHASSLAMPSAGLRSHRTLLWVWLTLSISVLLTTPHSRSCGRVIKLVARVSRDVIVTRGSFSNSERSSDEDLSALSLLTMESKPGSRICPHGLGCSSSLVVNDYIERGLSTYIKSLCRASIRPNIDVEQHRGCGTMKPRSHCPYRAHGSSTT